MAHRRHPPSPALTRPHPPSPALTRPPGDLSRESGRGADRLPLPPARERVGVRALLPLPPWRERVGVRALLPLPPWRERVGVRAPSGALCA